jgi:hypothetical protein
MSELLVNKVCLRSFLYDVPFCLERSYPLPATPLNSIRAFESRMICMLISDEDSYDWRSMRLERQIHGAFMHVQPVVEGLTCVGRAAGMCQARQGRLSGASVRDQLLTHSTTIMGLKQNMTGIVGCSKS